MKRDDGTTKLEFYKRPGEVWEAMYRDCEQAEKSIAFEQYIIGNDEIGRRFLKLFAEKAEAGVSIHLLFDAIGSQPVTFSSLIGKIREYGGIVQFYNPIKWHNILRPSKWLPRNHNKSMLIDSRIAYVGGACMADYMKDWRDLHVRITGGLCASIAENLMKPQATDNKRRKSKDGDFIYVVSAARMRPSPVYRELLLQIREAKKTIYMVTPYFMPPLRLRLALIRAVRRGVDVKVMTTDKSDVPLASLVSQSYFPRILRKGISILSYQGEVLHAKYAVIDDMWATLGSTNIDYLSLIRNREANILIHDGATITRLKQDFIADMAKCTTLTPDDWKRKSLLLKLIGYAGRPFKKVI